MDGNEKLPDGWVKVKSKSRPGNPEYFYNAKLKLSIWQFSDLKKFTSNTNGAKPTAKRSPVKPAKISTSGTSILDRSKAIKKNVAKERMERLQGVISDEVKRGTQSNQKLNVFKDIVQVKNFRRDDKKNIALDRMNQLSNTLEKEVKKANFQMPSASSSLKSDVPKNSQAIRIKEENQELASKENDVVMMDISMESEELSEYETMEWEEIPETEVILKVQEIRTTDVQSTPSMLINQPDKLSSLLHSGFYIIVDTNVLLSNLESVKEIKGKMFKDIGTATIFLPYIVLSELDRIKTREENIARLARRAITFIDECFKCKDQFLIGQSALESIQKQIIPIDCGDDEILNCCLQVQEINKKIILLSNDKNLRNKAFVNKIKSFSRDMLNFADYNLKNDIKFD